MLRMPQPKEGDLLRDVQSTDARAGQLWRDRQSWVRSSKTSQAKASNERCDHEHRQHHAHDRDQL